MCIRDSDDPQLSFLFLYMFYSEKNSFWECVAYTQFFVITGIATFASSASSEIRCTILIFALYSVHRINNKRKPYFHTDENRLQNLSLCIAVANIAIIQIMNSLEEELVNEAVITNIYIFALTLNTLFLLAAIRSIAKVIYLEHQDKLGPLLEKCKGKFKRRED
eukprot:TRINITY_DN24869_c0_g1_i2.p1 TRINITY_DN24869_c0_g1~~TRINITY_DN24869_c0_g1_i2.p1  ORF type:complete len:164 (+),score=14.62 TRINITY_DN24869_c0_g1_i2:64-555(+)